MRISLLLVTVLFFGMVGIQAQNVSPSDAQAEKARIERLVGLAKLWGTVKYFHPYPAYRQIDWDKALIEAIPRVNAAKTAQEYEAAVDSMLAALGDKATRAKIKAKESKTENQTPTKDTKEPVKLENGILMIDALAIAGIFQQDANRRTEVLTKANELLPPAKAVLIDLRGTGAVDEEVSGYFLDSFLQTFLPSILERDVALGSLRYRVHNGYSPQVGMTSGGYYSALMNAAPETLAGNGKTKTPTLVFLADQDSPSVALLGGLQAAKLAFVVQDGAAATSDAGAITTKLRLPDSVEVTMRTAELVNPDGSLGFSADLVAPKGAALKAAQDVIAENKFVSTRANTVSAFAPQTSQKEKPYAEMEFPSAEYRLLALFRFWNVINYFFPYKNLTGSDWNDVLPRYIPKLEANKSAIDYQMTVRELAAETHDSHVGVRNARALDAKIGLFTAPVVLRFVENRTIVAKVLDAQSPLKVGDVVVAIDGEPVEKRLEFLSRLTSASTPQALMYNVHFQLLRGEKDSLARLTVRGADGKTREVEAARSLSRQDPKLFDILQRTTPVVEILPSGFGYVDLDRLTVAEVDKMFETIKNAPAVIFDMRGYPNGTAWSVAPRLTGKKSPVGALFSRPIAPATSFYDGVFENSNYSFEQTIPEAKGDVYNGKVVMLINEESISQAEHTCLFFEAARPDITFIGTPTMGANGDVTTMVLPGNLVVSFSGHSVRHADGRQLQRIGIEPTIKVAPTIRGLADGRDEILEAAVKFLQTNQAKR